MLNQALQLHKGNVEQLPGTVYDKKAMYHS